MLKLLLVEFALAVSVVVLVVDVLALVQSHKCRPRSGAHSAGLSYYSDCDVSCVPVLRRATASMSR